MNTHTIKQKERGIGQGSSKQEEGEEETEESEEATQSHNR